MRVVLDTNVLISGGIATGTPHDVLVAGYSGEYQIVVSVPTLTEFRKTLQKYPDRFGLDEAEIQQEVETLRYYAEFVDPDKDFSVVDADPDDDKFFETAVAGHADYMVSGDQHLLDVESFEGIAVLTPREFYEILSGNQ